MARSIIRPAIGEHHPVCHQLAASIYEQRGYLMKRNLIIVLAVVWIATGTIGCQSLKNVMPGSSKPAEPTLYSQVPADLQAPVDEAMSEIQSAKDGLALAKEKVELAKLKKERANLEKKFADREEKLAETVVKQAEATFELRKMEAIDKAGLGDKAANINEIAGLKTDALSLESKVIEIKADMATMELDLKEMTAKVEEQAAKISSE